MGKIILSIFVAAIILVAIGVGGFYLFSKNKNIKFVIENSSQPTASPNPPIVPTTTSPTSSPVSPTGQSDIPAGWLTYKSPKYGFQISFPSNYKALDDPNNLYGWKNGVVLIYKSGQSYDLAIQAWSSEADYKAEYKDSTILTVYKVGSRFITLLNANKTPEVSSIIDTFKKL